MRGGGGAVGRTLNDEDDEVYTSSDEEEELQEAKVGGRSRPLVPFIRRPSFCGFHWEVLYRSLIYTHMAVYTWRCTRGDVYTWMCTRGGGVYSQVRRRCGERLAIDEQRRKHVCGGEWCGE